MSNCLFYLKQKFLNYNDFQLEIDKYEKTTGYKISVFDSKKNKEGSNFEFLYKVLKCTKAGVSKKKGKGIRNKESQKLNCPFLLRIKISKNKNYLELSQVHLIHSHTIDNQSLAVQCDNSHSLEPEVTDILVNAHNDKKDQIEDSIRDNVCQIVEPNVNILFDEIKEKQNQPFNDDAVQFDNSQRLETESTNISVNAYDQKQVNQTDDNASLASNNCEILEPVISNIVEENKKEIRENKNQTFNVDAVQFDNSQGLETESTNISVNAYDQKQVNQTDDNASLASNNCEIVKPVMCNIVEENEKEIRENKIQTFNEDSLKNDAIHSSTPQIVSINNCKAPSGENSKKSNKCKDVLSLKLEMTSLNEKKKEVGRPKGAVKTAIGLPIKKAEAFQDLSKISKLKRILEWLNVPQNVISLTLSGECVLKYTQMKEYFKDLSDSFLDKQVVVDDFVDYFEGMCLRHFKIAIIKRRKNSIYKCPFCQSQVYDSDRSIRCDSCLKWLHEKCANVKLTRKLGSEEVKWFCRLCIKT